MTNLAHLSIGTVTDRIDLINPEGILERGWEPVAGDTDDVFSKSALADYRKLQYYREKTTVEKIPYVVHRPTTDEIIELVQDLRRMLRKAKDYWVEKWNDDFVYVQAQAHCETNARYAIIHTGEVPKDENPSSQPFQQQDGATMRQVLLLERGPWLNAAPGTATCIEACAPENYYCWPSYQTFDGDSTRINCSAYAGIDDIPGGSYFSAEAWVRANGWGESNAGFIICKIDNPASAPGWKLWTDNVNGLCGYIYFGTTSAISWGGLDEWTPDGEWHHVLMGYDSTSRQVRLFIDGTEISSYVVQSVSVGPYITDVGEDLIIGNTQTSSNTWDGDIGWVRVGAGAKFADFIPDPRCQIPEGGTGIWIVEGFGQNTGNRANPAAAPGFIAFPVWGCDCHRAEGRQCSPEERCGPAHLLFNAVDSLVGLGDFAGNQDLPDDGIDFTVEAWIKPDSWGGGLGGTQSTIAQKRDDPTNTLGWHFGITQANGLEFWVNGATTDAHVASGTDEFTPDGQWHHVQGVKRDGGSLTAQLFLAIDGKWVTSYTINAIKTGAYGTDVGQLMFIGDNAAFTGAFDGAIGWVKVWTKARFLYADFDPPPRCELGEIGMSWTDLEGFWIYEGIGDLTWNRSYTGGRGGIARASWECTCDDDNYPGTSCETQPYIVNYLKTGGLTHTYFTDGPLGWSGNLQAGALPHLLLPPIPAIGDAVYFGCDETLLDTGPFCNLVFDIRDDQLGLTGVWEYWNTPAVNFLALTVQDNTNADGLMTGDGFDTEGIKSVHWKQLLTWGVEDLRTASGDATAPPVSAWWIRWRVTNAPGSVHAPEQHNRHVYTISWPYIEVQEDDIPGDIAASLALELFNESDHDGGTNPPLLSTGRVMAGLRNLERGEDFVAYFNASDEQNPPFITCTLNPAPAGGPILFATTLAAPTGRWVHYQNLDNADLVCWWSIDADYSAQFFGEYRAFVRCDISGGANVGDVALAIGISYGATAASLVYGEWKFNEYTTAPFMVELGRVVIPPSDMVSSSDNAEIRIELYAVSGTAGAIGLYVMDLILMPVDEWGGEFTSIPDTSKYLAGNRSMAWGDWGGKGTYLFVDSITYPKTDIRALSKIRTSENFVSLVRPVSNRPAPLRQNATQRLWFLCERFTATNRAGSFEIAHSVQIYSEAHYLSMRGDR